MPDYIVAILMFWMYSLGYLTAYGLAHQSDPFWHGFIDGLTFRKIWMR